MENYRYANELFYLVCNKTKYFYNNIITIDSIIDIAYAHIKYHFNSEDSNSHFPVILEELLFSMLDKKNYETAQKFVYNLIKLDKNNRYDSFSYSVLSSLIRCMEKKYLSRILLEKFEDMYKKFGNEELLKDFNNIKFGFTNKTLKGKSSDNVDILYIEEFIIKRQYIEQNITYETLEKLLMSIVESDFINQINVVRILEYITQNKEDFLDEKDSLFDEYTIDYVTIYFKALSASKDIEAVKKLIESDIIQKEIKYAISKYRTREYSRDTVVGNNIIISFDLYDSMIELIMKKYQQEYIAHIITSYIDIINDAQVKSDLSTIMKALDFIYVDSVTISSLEEIERINQRVQSLLLNIGYPHYKTVLSIYKLFILKVCEINYRYAVKVLVEFSKMSTPEAVNYLNECIGEIYIVRGKEHFIEFITFDNSLFEKLLLDSKKMCSLIYKMKIGNATDNFEDILELTLSKAEAISKADDLVTALLFSTNYRMVVDENELLLIHNQVLKMQDEATKAKLLRKIELLAKKKGMKYNA